MKYLNSLEWQISKELVPYEQALLHMEQYVEQIINHNANGKIWLLEHQPVYTAGTSAKEDDILDKNKFPIIAAGRGGQYTYHGPGQRTVYTIFDLKKLAAPQAPDIRSFVYLIEEWIIRTLAKFRIIGERRAGRVGVWVMLPSGQESKIAAIGIRVRKWVSFHGFAINVSPDLSHYQGIVPCGIRDYGVTSMAALGVKVTMEEVDETLAAVLKELSS